MFSYGLVIGRTIVTNILSTFVVIGTVGIGGTNWETTNSRSTSDVGLVCRQSRTGRHSVSNSNLCSVIKDGIGPGIAGTVGLNLFVGTTFTGSILRSRTSLTSANCTDDVKSTTSASNICVTITSPRGISTRAVSTRARFRFRIVGSSTRGIGTTTGRRSVGSGSNIGLGDSTSCRAVSTTKRPSSPGSNHTRTSNTTSFSSSCVNILTESTGTEGSSSLDS